MSFWKKEAGQWKQVLWVWVTQIVNSSPYQEACFFTLGLILLTVRFKWVERENHASGNRESLVKQKRHTQDKWVVLPLRFTCQTCLCSLWYKLAIQDIWELTSSPREQIKSRCVPQRDRNPNTMIIFWFVPFVCLCFAIICCEGSSAIMLTEKNGGSSLTDVLKAFQTPRGILLLFHRSGNVIELSVMFHLSIKCMHLLWAQWKVRTCAVDEYKVREAEDKQPHLPFI